MLIILLACVAAAAARPSFIAVPADQIAFVDLTRLHVRVPRQTLSPPPVQQLPQALYEDEYEPAVQQYQQHEPQPVLQQQQYQQQPIGLLPPAEHQQPIRVAPLQHRRQQQDIASAPSLGASQSLAERPPDFGEYVDFGAHTGDNGAFGWYADYPVNQFEDHSRY